MTDDLHPTTIDLSREPAFRIAGLDVRPATLEVVTDDGVREQLEPRIMQVFVALARRRGEVVSRDELNELCWGGRIVGDDAINRCIARIRRLAQAHGGFEVATVPRVGFRLSEATNGTGLRRSWPRRPLWAAVAAVVAVSAAAGGFMVWRSAAGADTAPEPRVAISDFRAVTGDPGDRALAASLSEDLAGVLGEHAVGAAPVSDGGRASSPADLRLGGAVSREGGVWRVRAFLVDVASDLTLWSDQFESPVGQEAALRDEVAVESADAAFYALESLADRSLRRDPQTIALVIAAEKRMSNPSSARSGDALRLFERALARAPHSARTRGLMAAELVDQVRSAPEEQRPALIQRVRSEAQRAISTNRRDAGGAYEALYMLARLDPGSDLAAAERILLTSVRVAEDFEWGHMRQCRFLTELGRPSEALPYCQRARALRPLAPPIEWSYVNALNAVGEAGRAREAMGIAARNHPSHFETRRSEFEIEALDGDPARAVTLLHDPSSPLRVLRPQTVQALDAFLAARRSGSAKDAETAMALLWEDARVNPMGPRSVVLAATRLGRIDEAFRALETFGAAPPRDDVGLRTGLLLDPFLAPLRADPRFWREAAKAGYLQFWRTTNEWPDFCRDPGRPIDCPGLAARAVGAG